jgi:hypothetical protein
MIIYISKQTTKNSTNEHSSHDNYDPQQRSPLQALKWRYNCLMSTYWCVVKPPCIIFPCLLFFTQHHIWYSAQERQGNKTTMTKDSLQRTRLSISSPSWMVAHFAKYSTFLSLPKTYSNSCTARTCGHSPSSLRKLLQCPTRYPQLCPVVYVSLVHSPPTL